MSVEFKYKNGESRVMEERYARILRDLGHGMYENRMLTAQIPRTPSRVVNVVNPDEVDSAGVKWDEALHSGDRAKKADGTWKKRPGRSHSAG